MPQDLLDEEVNQPYRIFQSKVRHIYVEALVGDQGKQFLLRAEQFLAHLGPRDLDLGLVSALVTLGQDKIDIADDLLQLIQR